MALIEVKITAEDSRQLAVFLTALAAVHNLTLPSAAPVAVPVDEPTANVPEAYGEPEVAPEPKPARRKRRTKAEVEADKAAAAEATGETITTPDAAPDPEPETPALTRQDVEKAMRALLEAGPVGGEKMVALLDELDAKNDAGEAKISALAEDRYAEAIEKAMALAAEVKKGAGDAAKVLE